MISPTDPLARADMRFAPSLRVDGPRPGVLR